MTDDKIEIVLLRKEKRLAETAAQWFSEKWDVSKAEYSTSIKLCQSRLETVPQWYLLMDGSEIIGGAGVIENDFHNRKDLTPNICALFIEPQYRNKGLAKFLLDFICKDLSAFGFKKLYLITDIVGFYEKCGWQFLCMTKEDSGEAARMYHKELR